MPVLVQVYGLGFRVFYLWIPRYDLGIHIPARRWQAEPVSSTHEPLLFIFLFFEEEALHVSQICQSQQHQRTAKGNRAVVWLLSRQCPVRRFRPGWPVHRLASWRVLWYRLHGGAGTAMAVRQGA